VQHNSIAVTALPVITLHFQTVTVDDLEMQNPARAADFEDRLTRPIDGLSAHLLLGFDFLTLTVDQNEPPSPSFG
jgi:hypothetical protein